MNKPGDTKSEPPASSQSVGVAFVMGMFNVITEAVKNVLDRWILLAIIVCVFAAYIVWICLLPSADRAAHGPVEIVDALARLVQSNAFAYAGWVVAFLVSGISYLVVRIVLRRNGVQGDLLQESRKAVDPERLSSRSNEVAAAVEEMIGQAPGRKDDGKQLAIDYSRNAEGPKPVGREEKK